MPTFPLNGAVNLPARSFNVQLLAAGLATAMSGDDAGRYDRVQAVVVSLTDAVAPTSLVSISAAQSKAEGNSGNTIFTYTVTRSLTVGSLVVPWTFAAGGTIADDFTGGILPSGGGISFADGVATGTFSISVAGDLIVEPDEVFTVSIQPPAGTAAGGALSATGTILNDDAAQVTPTLSLSSAVTQAEGDSGTAAFVWTLTLTRNGSTASYPYTWAVTGTGSNAANAADFGGTFPSGSGTFAAGETSKTITVLATGDTAVEPAETFLLTVNATGLASVTSTGTISNDDVAATPTVSISAAQSKSEGNSGATLFTYTVTRSSSSGAVNVPWTLAAGGTSADDFTSGALPTGGTVAMADGVATGTFSISVNGDTVVEGDETFTVSIAAPSGYALGSPTSATGTILNDDNATPSYAARTANTEPSTATLASPTSDTLIASAASALAGSTAGAGTWANLPLGSNPGVHNRQADGSGVGGNSAGRAGSLLTGIVSADGEIAADLQVNTTGSEGQAGLLARASTSDAAGTYYEMRYGFANTVQLFRVNAGVETQLALVNGLTGLAAGTAYPARMRLNDITDTNGAVLSTAIRCFFNGAELISVVDTAPLPVGVYGLRGGRNARFKNLTIAAWQIQSATVLTPNVYDASASGVVVSVLTATTPSTTMTLADNDGGRFALVDTGRKIGGRAQYNLVTTGTQVTIAGGNARSVVLRESKTGYTAKDTSVSLGVVAPLAAKPVRYITANAGEHNSQVGGGGASQDAWHTYALMPIGSVADDLRPVFRAMVIGGDGKEYLPCTAASINKCSIMIEGGKFRVPVTFSGSRGVTIPMTVTGIVEADPVTPAMFGLIEWPRNAQIRVCAQGRVTGAIPLGEVGSQGDAAQCFHSTYSSTNEIDWIDDAAITPPNYAGKANAGAALFLTAVVGKTAFGAVHALGDSLTYGFDETFNITRFGAGWFGRMSNIAGIIPGYRSARAGIAGTAYVGNGEGRRAMVAKGYATIGIDFFGTNDLNSAGTGEPTTINAMHTSVTADFKASGMKSLRGQLMPRATDYAIPLTSISVSGTIATATITDTTSIATLQVGQTINLAGNTPTALNGLKVITAISGNTFSYTVTSGTASATTVGSFSAAFSNQLQAIPAGWAGNGTSNRDVINAKNVSDASAGTIDGVIDFLSVVSQPGNSGLWKYDGLTANLVITDASGTHPNAAGHILMAAVARNAVVALAPELA